MLQDVTLPPLGATMVQVEISMVGLCHTDIHMRDNDWGTTNYPILLGHEGVGVVTHIGAGVTAHAVGDRVGLGWIRDSCGNCKQCRVGRDNICEQGYTGTYLGSAAGCWGKERNNETGGCYAKVQRIEQRFAVSLPGGLDDAICCPLLCGGATTYEPIVNLADAGDRVGILGLGGLGRSGLKLAKLRGCHVVAISGSPHKRDLALQCGADEFWVYDDATDMPKLDVLIDTRPVNSDLNGALALLGFNGKYCRLGIPAAAQQDFTSQWIPLVFQQHTICSTVVTGSARLNELMELCGRNVDFVLRGEDEWSAEVIPFDQINVGLHNLLNRKNNGYRYVLKW